MALYKLFPEKSPILENAWKQRFYTKTGQLILKISLALFNIQMHNKSTFYENVLNLILFNMQRHKKRTFYENALNLTLLI